jgi:hypothetical protein
MIDFCSVKKLMMIVFMAFSLGFCFSSKADQYQSNELIESKGQSAKTVKSISELEAELNDLNDAYTKDSTARYLARHYAQKNNQASIIKAIEYYRLSLEGKGLSVVARQATMLELLAVYFQNEMYRDFVNGIDQYIKLNGKITLGLDIKAMLSYYHLNKKKKSLSIANKLFKAHSNHQVTLGLNDLNQLLFTYYNLADFLKSAQVQSFIIALDEHSVEQWLRLSKLHLKNNQPDQAAEVMLLMVQKGLLLEQDNLVLMTDLIHNSGNAFIAGRLMQQLLDEFRVDHNLENFDRLFKYWYLSQEIDKAAVALKNSLKYDHSIKRLLDLAQVYYQQRHWVNMNATIKEACSWPLKSKYVGRANLLLGISELKLNNQEDAIEAFYNATMIAGKVAEAMAYLSYLKVDTSDMRRYESISGVCEPSSS